jgi:serine/threonine protein kinase
MLQFHAVSRKRKPFSKRLPDYGEINYSRAADRKISREDVFEYETFRRSLMNQEEKWYPVPDPDCQEPSWKSRHYLTCNMMHEGDYFSDVNVQNVGSGFSRVAWAVQDYTMETSVLKMLKLIHNVTLDTLDEVHLDAIIMEELSSSPRIMDMHSFCGTSVIATNMAYSVLDEITPPGSKLWSSLPSHRVVLRNRLSPSTKLRYALEMAESIADLHGRAIIHGDIHLGQWARKRPDDRLVLNDFNLAKVLSWNATNGKYCKAQSGRGNGNYRSPEEVEWTGLDEKIDVYSFGNNIFALLTGRTVSVENRDQKKAVAKYSVATNAFFKTKSFVERKLVEIMIRCWDFNPKTRPSIFDVVKFLRDTTEQDNMRTLMNVENEALLVTQH